MIYKILTVNTAILNSSSSSQDRLLSPFPVKCWPQAFHATFIHNTQRKEEDKIGWGRSLGTTICHTTTTPHTLMDQDVG